MTARTVDWRSLSLFLLHLALLGLSIGLAAAGRLPLYAAFLLSLFAFNFSFTIWHECAHNTMFRSKAASTAVGILSSFALVYPGFFALRREHLMHHKHQGDPALDPVFVRVQCRPWAFPFNLAWAILFRRGAPTPEHRLTRGEALADAVNYLLFGGLVAGSIATGLWPVLVFAWVLPRLVILPIHAFYVCYLPHSGYGDGAYETYRIVLRNPFTRYLTLYHAYHGLHHLWPAIPWHEYRRTYEERKPELRARGVRISGGPE